jgi:hypothetical protein
MSDIATREMNVPAAPLPEARCSVSVRAAAPDDLPFVDALQKMHSHMVGFFPRKQIEKNIADGQVLIAEEGGFVLDDPPRQACLSLKGTATLWHTGVTPM